MNRAPSRAAARPISLADARCWWSAAAGLERGLLPQRAAGLSGGHDAAAPGPAAPGIARPGDRGGARQHPAGPERDGPAGGARRAGVPRLSARLACEPPRRFRLQAQTSLTGPELDIGSNDDLFWIWLRQHEPPITAFCRHDQYAQSQARRLLPIRADWMPELLGLVNFRPDRLPRRALSAARWPARDPQPPRFGRGRELLKIDDPRRHDRSGGRAAPVHAGRRAAGERPHHAAIGSTRLRGRPCRSWSRSPGPRPGSTSSSNWRRSRSTAPAPTRPSSGRCRPTLATSRSIWPIRRWSSGPPAAMTPGTGGTAAGAGIAGALGAYDGSGSTAASSPGPWRGPGRWSRAEAREPADLAVAAGLEVVKPHESSRVSSSCSRSASTRRGLRAVSAGRLSARPARRLIGEPEGSNPARGGGR